MNKFERILKGIHGKTGLDIDVYDIFGKLIVTTAEEGKNFNFRHVKEFPEGINSDPEHDLTYFLINVGKENLIGMISGSSDVSRNYAYMVCAMLEMNASTPDARLSKNDAFKALLYGELSPEEAVKFQKDYALPDEASFVILLEADPKVIGEIFNFFGSFSDDSRDTPVLVEDNQIAYVKFLTADEGYLSALEFADMLVKSIEMELNISRVNVGTGPVAATFADIPAVFAECRTALKIGMQINKKSRVHSYKEYILMKMIDDIDPDTLRGYLKVLVDAGSKEILTDDDMMSTAEEFLNNDLNISETARLLYMHRNTLMYRLDKIERSMGLNIRKFEDAVTFRIVMLLYNKIKG